MLDDLIGKSIDINMFDGNCKNDLIGADHAKVSVNAYFVKHGRQKEYATKMYKSRQYLTLVEGNDIVNQQGAER